MQPRKWPRCVKTGQHWRLIWIDFVVSTNLQNGNQVYVYKAFSDKSTCTNIPTIMAPGMQHPCLFQTYWHLTSCPGAKFQFGYICVSRTPNICSSQDIPRFMCMYRTMKNILIIYSHWETVKNTWHYITLQHYITLHYITFIIYILFITLHYTTLHCNRVPANALQRCILDKYLHTHLKNLENILPCLHTRVLGSFQADTLIYVLT